MKRVPATRIQIWFFLLLMVLGAAAQSVGTTAFEFLRQEYSARSEAIGGNLISFSGDANGMFVNPAGLASLANPQWGVNYVDHLLDLQGGQLVYARPATRFGTLGLGLLYLNYGDFQETDAFGQETGRSFSASEFALAASLSNVLGPDFDYGVNLKLIYSSLDNVNAVAVALDGGLQYHAPFSNQLTFAVVVSNVGLVLDDYTGTDEDLPIVVRVGFSKRLEHLPLVISGALNDLTLETGDFWDRAKRFSVGGEFDISEQVKFRLGYNNEVNDNVRPLGRRGFGGMTAGLGIAWKSFRFDYAYSAYGELGSQNRLAISGGF
ncbi:MAG: hypothetical protein D6715_08560 [Calditrichaeota bacterium]|nr:MAG: hypothetical protein D6715_08560 [Calditrichota bacterium]